MVWKKTSKIVCLVGQIEGNSPFLSPIVEKHMKFKQRPEKIKKYAKFLFDCWMLKLLLLSCVIVDRDLQFMKDLARQEVERDTEVGSEDLFAKSATDGVVGEISRMKFKQRPEKFKKYAKFLFDCWMLKLLLLSCVIANRDLQFK
jgi:hypothetical protein